MLKQVDSESIYNLILGPSPFDWYYTQLYQSVLHTHLMFLSKLNKVSSNLPETKLINLNPLKIDILTDIECEYIS